MKSKTLGLSLFTCAWLIFLAAYVIYGLKAPFGDFWHIDGVAVLATLGNALFVTALVRYDESFGIA